MTTYTAILDTQVDPDAPITSGLGYQFRDNPLAMAEGASGAPRFAQKSLIGNMGASGSVSFTSLSEWSGFISHVFVNNPGGSSRNITIAASDDGITYGAAATFFTIPAATTTSGILFCDFSSGTVKYAVNLGSPSGGLTSSGSVSVTGMSSSTTAIRFTNGADLVTAVMVLPNGGESAV